MGYNSITLVQMSTHKLGIKRSPFYCIHTRLYVRTISCTNGLGICCATCFIIFDHSISKYWFLLWWAHENKSRPENECHINLLHYERAGVFFNWDLTIQANKCTTFAAVISFVKHHKLLLCYKNFKWRVNNLVGRCTYNQFTSKCKVFEMSPFA